MIFSTFVSAYQRSTTSPDFFDKLTAPMGRKYPPGIPEDSAEVFDRQQKLWYDSPDEHA